MQPNANSVQETLNKALTIILNQNISITGAGRTDTGVHAKEMFAHFDVETGFDCEKLVHKLNSFLPNDIVIYTIFEVNQENHARFDAAKRTYEYHIHTFKNAFLDNQSWQFSQKFDLDLMNKASEILLNFADFQCFSKVNTDVNTFDCTIFEAFWKQENESVVFTISANRFLRNMVRAIVGTLINVGLHKISLEDFQQIIINKNRSEAGFSVPAHGLYLTKIKYDFL